MAGNSSDEINKNKYDLGMIEEYRATGNPDIAGKLYTPYMHLVYGVCLKYFKNRDDAKDGVMAIFEKLLTELERHRVENFKSWLYVLARNYCLMKLRSDKSEKQKALSVLHDSELFMENTPELHPIDRENGISEKALEDCIADLKEEQRKCIILFYYENRSYREIADKLKMEEKKVKSHLQNAKRNLKICLEERND